jgi:hypothetical protein
VCIIPGLDVHVYRSYVILCFPMLTINTNFDKCDSLVVFEINRIVYTISLTNIRYIYIFKCPCLRGKHFTLNSLSYHFSPFENENYHRFIISLQANTLTSLSPYATDLTSDRYKRIICIGKKVCNCSCFEIDQEKDAILLIIGIVYGVCRIVIKSVQQCTFFLFSRESAFSRRLEIGK